MKPSEIAFSLVRIPLDFLMTLLAFVIAWRVRLIADFIPGVQLPFDAGSVPSFSIYLQFSIAAATCLTLLFAINKNYTLKTTFSLGREIKQVITTATLWLMAIVVYFFLIRTFPFSRLALMYTWVLTMVFVMSGRGMIRWIQYFMLKAGIGCQQLLFIGYNKITVQLWNALQKDHSYQIAGYVDEFRGDHLAQNNRKGEKLPFLGQIEQLANIVKQNRIEEIIQTTTHLSQQKNVEILNFCRENHLGFSFVPNLLEVQQTNIETETLAGIPVIKLKPTPLDGWGKVIKRIFDIIGSLLGLTILSPIMAVITIAIKYDSKGTVFFKYLDDGTRVKRVGERGKLFHFYKFRTMYPSTHNLRYTKLAHKDLRGGSPLVKIKDDPRVTGIGRFLRKTSLDELPQLVNVLKGEMSLVGPRPHLPEEVAKYQKQHKFVLTIKPGITGLAQVSGRSDLDFEEEVRLDTYYIEYWSPWMDMKVLLKTILILLKGYRE